MRVRQFGDLLEKLIEVEDRRDLVVDLDERCQKVWICTEDRFHNLRASSMILIPELVPSREAPACSIATRLAVGLMPPAALIWISGSSVVAHQRHVFDGGAGRSIARRRLHEVRPDPICDLAGTDLFFRVR